MERFVQTFGAQPNLYAVDHPLRATLDRLLGPDGHAAAKGKLNAIAADAAGPLREAHLDAEANPPRLVQYDGWGRRVDEVRTSAGWETLRRAAAEYGLVALPYDDDARKLWGAGARVVQHALLHLYGPESATFTCPVAMADGAAALLSRDDTEPRVRDAWLPRLTTRDPDRATCSGQWMTETTGGSDISRTGTVARQDERGDWRLTGEKWFCSAIDSQLAIALARPEGAPEGSRHLACFLVPRYAADVPGAARTLSPGDTAPGLRIHRLKDKLGTRAVPSAEVGLDSAYAIPVSDPHQPGLAKMMTLVQITRLHNAAAAAAGMRRGLIQVRRHADTREAFGLRLWRQPLHRETLAWLAVDAEAAFALTALCFAALGRVEVDRDGESAALLRLAATLAKAGTGKLAVSAATEYLECVGGNGYIEDTGFPRLLRDAQVLPIWEGTTNVLSLDVLRALAKDPDALPAYLGYLDRVIDVAAGSGERWLTGVVDDLAGVRRDVAEQAEKAGADAASDRAQAGARALTLRMANTLAAGALVEQAAFEAAAGNARTALVASLFVRRRLLGADTDGEGHRAFAHLVDAEPL
jgi:alkylation response protein AidB-like acyl-CoA dehydrogenase